MGLFARRVMVCFATSGLLAGCDRPAAPKPPFEVTVVTTRIAEYAPVISLTGSIAARISSELSFRGSGRVLQRLVDVGDHVVQGQPLAVLDPQEQEQDVVSARAAVDSAEAKVRQTSSELNRQNALITSGFTTRPERDQAEEAFRTAQSLLDAAHAQLGIAQDGLKNVVLNAPTSGLITARTVEAGQVVQAAQVAYTLAQDGPRDAVFDVYEAIFIQEPEARDIRVALVSDPNVAAIARPREVSPLLDTNTGTVKVKFDILQPPPAMTLGTAITGTGNATARRAVILPWNALSSQDGKPAVWIVDPASKTVSLHPIEVATYEVERIVVGGGLGPDQMVVINGQQLLHAGQIVSIDPGPGS